MNLNLFELSLANVVNGLVEDTITLPSRLPQQLSDQIYENVPNENKADVLLRNHGKLRITKLEVLDTADLKYFRTIKKLNLEFLNLRNISISKKTKNIESLIQSLLNDSSKKRIRGLDVGRYHKHNEKWLGKVLNILPNLKSLTGDNYMVNFKLLPCVYPNLTTLNIQEARIENLDGISKFPNLESLNIGGILFSKFEDMEELFELRKLKTLDTSKTTFRYLGDSIEYFSQSVKALPELELVDCTATKIDELMLDKIRKTHPNLKTIVLIDTQFSSLVLPNIQCLNTATLKSGVETCKYLKSIDRLDVLEETMKEMKSLIAEELRKSPMDLNTLYDYLKFLNKCVGILPMDPSKPLYKEIKKGLSKLKEDAFYRHLDKTGQEMLDSCLYKTFSTSNCPGDQLSFALWKCGDKIDMGEGWMLVRGTLP